MLLGAASFTLAKSKSDFLIVEHTQQLVVYNQYQQRATSREKSALLPFTPFKILSANDMLGDGFTPCMKVESDGKVFFLEKDNNGVLVGADRAGLQKLYRNTIAFGDTVEILKSNTLTMLDARNRNRTSLQHSTRVIRVFEVNGLVYAKLLGTNEQFGWCDFARTDERRDWKVVEAASISLPDQLQTILPHVQLTVNEVNATLSRLFSHLNNRSSQRLQSPQWRVQLSDSAVACTLETETPPGHFSESTQQLGKRMESILIGTDLRVVSSPGRPGRIDICRSVQ